MAAGVNDYFRLLGGASSLVNTPKTTATRAAAGATLTVDNCNWDQTTGKVFATYQVNTSGAVVAGTETIWLGIVTGTTSIGSLSRVAGASDTGNAIGDYVELLPASKWANDIITGLLAAGLNQDGTQTPVVKTSINDVNGNEVIKTPATASAVNEITVTNAATGNAPSISATGTDSTVNLNLRGKGLAKTVTIGAGATTIYPYDYVASGCVLSGDGYGASLNFSMTSGVVVINGNPVTVASFSASAATASRDTYVDVLDNGDGTGLVVKTGGNIVTNNAASPALAANSIRIGIVVSGAGNIAAASSINQGQLDRVLPIASSRPYTFTDSLGNIICPRDPARRMLGFCNVTNSQAGVTATVARTGCFCPVILPVGGSADLVALDIGQSSASANSIWTLPITDGVAGTALRTGQTTNVVANISGEVVTLAEQTVAAGGLKTYSVSVGSNNSMTFSNTTLKVFRS